MLAQSGPRTPRANEPSAAVASTRDAAGDSYPIPAQDSDNNAVRVVVARARRRR